MPKKSPDDKSCKITLYIDTPKPLLRPFKDVTKHSQLESLFVNGGPDPVALTGHAFIGLTDAKGNEERWGFSGEEPALFKALSGMRGTFEKEDPVSPYNEAIIWHIGKNQYNAVQKSIDNLKKDPGTYKLFKRNCSTVAVSLLKSAGVKDIPGEKLGLTPYGLTIKKRYMLACRRLEVAKFKIKNAFNGLFGKAKAPASELLASLRSKPIPVPINNGMKAYRQNRKDGQTTPLDIGKVIASISRVRT